MAATGDLIPNLPQGTDHVGNFTVAGYYSPTPIDGPDLALFPTALGKQLDKLAQAMVAIANNQNETDQQRALDMQITTNSWQLIAMTQTQVTKVISETLQQIARNSGGG
jgi:hypothetical protein